MKTTQTVLLYWATMLILALLLFAVPTAARAQFAYMATNGTITITQYTGSASAVVIPDTIDGLPVTGIGDYAFSGSTLTAVTIPNSVSSIGSAPFVNSYYLSAISVGAQNLFYSSVDGVLFDKNQTALVEYPEGKVGSNYTIPNSIAKIGDDAFWGCALTSVTIPNRVTSIGTAAFEFSGYLTKATIGTGVTNIGDFAFAFCSRLGAAYFMGSSPAAVGNLIQQDQAGEGGPDLDGSFILAPTTVYYLPGTTGWSNTFAPGPYGVGLPTALWLPQTQITDGTFGVRNGQFGFNVTWAPDKTVVVEASADPANQLWLPVATNTPVSGSFYFSDSQWTHYASRYYRLRSP